MNILIANDHGAVALKQAIQNALEQEGHTVTNLGVDTEESVDYPDIAHKAATTFLKGGYDFGIVCCGSGAQVFDLYTAAMCKKHNNANFLAFGGRIQYPVPVIDMIHAYMEAQFEGGRHERRVSKLNDLCSNSN